MSGAKNYKKQVLLSVVRKVLPTGAYAWQQVAMAYKEQSGERSLHDADDVKRHWTETMCNKVKKPTGNAGPANDFILCCQRVHLKILKKNKALLMGGRLGTRLRQGENDDFESTV